jgi:hypothetical protein
VIRGSRLAIEYQGDAQLVEFDVYPGMAGWDAPTSRVHRAINRGPDTFEEIVVFELPRPDVDPQPQVNMHGGP